MDCSSRGLPRAGRRVVHEPGRGPGRRGRFRRPAPVRQRRGRRREHSVRRSRRRRPSVGRAGGRHGRPARRAGVRSRRGVREPAAPAGGGVVAAGSGAAAAARWVRGREVRSGRSVRTGPSEEVLEGRGVGLSLGERVGLRREEAAQGRRDARVVVHGVVDGGGGDPGRDDDGRDARPVPVEPEPRAGLLPEESTRIRTYSDGGSVRPNGFGERARGGADVVVEPAVLVVGDEEHGLGEHLGMRAQRPVDRGDQVVAALEVESGPGGRRRRVEVVVAGVLAVRAWAAVARLDERVVGERIRRDMARRSRRSRTSS